LYQGFYNLKDYPFRLSPDPAFMCMTAQHQEALSGLIYNVCTQAGLTVLVGEAGTGKTTLLYSLLGLLERRRFVTALCTTPTLTREEFYDLMMLKFGVACEPGMLKSRRLAALEQMLLRHRTEGKRSLLIVDEAQRLPEDLLEEIRLLLNLETPREKLLEIIVSGQPELSEILGRPELRQLKQRVSCICKLNALSMSELREYLHHRLGVAGMPQQTLFSEEVMQLIHEFTQGIPRLVNSLCNGSLQTGFGLQSREITTAIVEEAARDLELRRGDPAPPPFVVNRLMAVQPVPIEPPLRAAAPKVNGYGTEVSAARVPLESYASRQKSLGLFAGLIDRWR
jgi:type II secretory pathway predicted ATPase ExeA